MAFIPAAFKASSTLSVFPFASGASSKVSAAVCKQQRMHLSLRTCCCCGCEVWLGVVTDRQKQETKAKMYVECRSSNQMSSEEQVRISHVRCILLGYTFETEVSKGYRTADWKVRNIPLRLCCLCSRRGRRDMSGSTEVLLSLQPPTQCVRLMILRGYLERSANKLLC